MAILLHSLSLPLINLVLLGVVALYGGRPAQSREPTVKPFPFFGE